MDELTRIYTEAYESNNQQIIQVGDYVVALTKENGQITSAKINHPEKQVNVDALRQALSNGYNLKAAVFGAIENKPIKKEIELPSQVPLANPEPVKDQPEQGYRDPKIYWARKYNN